MWGPIINLEELPWYARWPIKGIAYALDLQLRLHEWRQRKGL